MAVNMLISMPIAKVTPNPLIMLSPNHIKIKAVINVEILESRIDAQARENPSSIAACRVLPDFSSSFNR